MSGCYLMEASSSLLRWRERVGLDGRGSGEALGGGKGGGTVIGIDHMRKEPTFNKVWGGIKKCVYIRQNRTLVKTCPKK